MNRSPAIGIPPQTRSYVVLFDPIGLANVGHLGAPGMAQYAFKKIPGGVPSKIARDQSDTKAASWRPVIGEIGFRNHPVFQAFRHFPVKCGQLVLTHMRIVIRAKEKVSYKIQILRR